MSFVDRFVAQFVIKEGTGTLFYTFAFPDEACISSVRDLDLRVSGMLTRHKLRFEIVAPASTVSDLRHPDKAQLHFEILVMRDQGMSYREIGAELGIHWTRVGQINRRSQE